MLIKGWERASLAIVGVMTWSSGAVAATPPRAHVGLEASLLSRTSTEVNVPTETPYGGAPTSTKVVANSTRFGLPGSAALSAGLLLVQKVDIGLRFGYATDTTKVGAESAAIEMETTALVFDPYAAY